MPELAPLISFVMLTWNSGQTVVDAVDGIVSAMSANRVGGFEILITDNGSTDGTLRLLEGYGDKTPLRVIRLGRNMGTSFGRNAALREARGRFICVMDSDVVIRHWPVRNTLGFIESRPCLLAPRLIYPDGAVQNSVKKFPTLTVKMLKLLKIFLGIGRFARLDFYEGFPFDRVARVDTAISAFWLFPASFLESVGLFDEKIFYSPEDIDYCLRVQKAGYPVVYYPGAVAVHHTQQISHRSPFSRIAFSHLAGLLYFFAKHGYFFSARRYVEYFSARFDSRAARATPAVRP